MEARVPRIMVAGTASGSGKTTFTCALLRMLSKRGLRVQACKCGPDYLDPTFHTSVLGVPSRNLDLFLGGEALARELLAEGAKDTDVIVIEGVMGYYDGIASGEDASSFALARATDTPVVLVVNARGRSLSVAAEVRGFAGFRNPSLVAGVVLNGVNAAYYPTLKEVVEREGGVPVLGYLPRLDEAVLASRHLGLVAADEVDDLTERIDAVASVLEDTLDVDALMALAQAAPALSFEASDLPEPCVGAPVIAIARDEAFSFYYRDCLEVLERLGARLAFFSPVHDAHLPKETSGIYLGGGYPELHAKELSDNRSLRDEVADAIGRGVPTIAECGGYLYLHDSLEDTDGHPWQMVGALSGAATKGSRLGCFGYVTLTARSDGLLVREGEELAAHEFHYWQSDRTDAAFLARKPQSARGWDCGVNDATLYAAFPHLYLRGCPQVAKRFVEACAAFTNREGSVS